MTFFSNSFNLSHFDFFSFSFSTFRTNQKFLLKGDDGDASPKSKKTKVNRV